MAVESLVFASSCSENTDCSSIDAILPAVVDHTGVAIYLTPYTGIYWQLTMIILCTNPMFEMLP